jgi:ribosomal protein L12E/L44/L45/RPP1/RPP2
MTDLEENTVTVHIAEKTTRKILNRLKKLDPDVLQKRLNNTRERASTLAIKLVRAKKEMKDLDRALQALATDADTVAPDPAPKRKRSKTPDPVKDDDDNNTQTEEDEQEEPVAKKSKPEPKAKKEKVDAPKKERKPKDAADKPKKKKADDVDLTDNVLSMADEDTLPDS